MFHVRLIAIAIVITTIAIVFILMATCLSDWSCSCSTGSSTTTTTLCAPASSMGQWTSWQSHVDHRRVYDYIKDELIIMKDLD